jgi:hypothetical protein
MFHGIRLGAGPRVAVAGPSLGSSRRSRSPDSTMRYTWCRNRALTTRPMVPAQPRCGRRATGRDGRSMHENLGAKGGLPMRAFPSREAWAAWLDAHHTDAAGVWLALPKKGGGQESCPTRMPWRWPFATDGSTVKKERSTSAAGCNGSPRDGRGAGGRASIETRRCR